MTIISSYLNFLPPDQQRFVLSFFSFQILGFIMCHISGRTVRLTYSLVLGVIFQWYVYGISALHVFLASLVNLALIKYIDTPKLGKTAMIYNFLHNSLIHLNRIIFYYDDWSIEISTTFMMTMCKFSSFAYCYQDGREEEGLTLDQKKYSVGEFTYFEYFAYIYFFPTSVCGPYIEFRDFMNFIENKEEYTNIPSTFFPALFRLFLAIIMSLVYVLLKPFAQASVIINEDGKYGLMTRIFAYVSGSIYEHKYISGFCFSDSAMAACGFAYTGPQEGKSHLSLFRKGFGVDIINLELVYSPPDFFRYWNIQVHIFLKRYIYQRSLTRTSSFAEKSWAQSKTFYLSGLWHGFHPAYFIVFFHFHLYTLFSNQVEHLRKKLNIKEIPMKTIWMNVFRGVILVFLVPYHCYMFICLDHIKLFQFLKVTYAFGTVLIVSLNIGIYLFRQFIHKYLPKEKDEIKTN